jgi:nitroimidazol reductase NimA-like FMN-containing flavoprotein (pyridoxamine 5'-phosphate oxidase superfamily)
VHLPLRLPIPARFPPRQPPENRQIPADARRSAPPNGCWLNASSRKDLVPPLHRTIIGMLGTLSTAEIENLLQTEVVARLGCHAEGRTYVVPVTYAYDGDSLFVQSADGLKVRMMLQNPMVCVEVDHIDDLANWQSVIAWGRFEPLFGTDATAALTRLRARLQPLVASETAPAAPRLTEGETRVRGGNGHASIYRVHLFEKTGRFERR